MTVLCYNTIQNYWSITIGTT